MNINPYQPGDSIDAPLLGRRQQLALALERLNQLNVCVIAPRSYGKSRLLRQVARLARNHGFSQCLLWDLRRHTPTTDEEFYRALSGEMVRQLQTAQDLTEWFKELGTTFEAVKGVFEELGAQEQKTLVVLDGVEGVIQSGSVSKNVWDTLRDLTEVRGVRFITGSRLPLRQLCPPDSRTSPFWNVFHQKPIRFGAFQEDDWAALLDPFKAKGVTIEESALKELRNWTGGIPLLVMAICERLFDSCVEGQSFSKSHVDEAAKQVMSDYREHIATLWEDLPQETRLDAVELARNHELSQSDLGKERADALLDRGLAARAAGTKLRQSCRIMETHANQQGQSLPEVKRLFSAAVDYDRNITEVFQLRLAMLQSDDGDMETHVRHLLEATHKPEVAKALIRNVAAECLEQLLLFEFPTGGIDAALVSSWDLEGRLHKEVDREILASTVPTKRGGRMKLMSLLHDENAAGKAKTRRSTFILLETVYEAGNFGHHADEIGEAVPRSFMNAIGGVAVELLTQVKEDTFPRVTQ